MELARNKFKQAIAEGRVQIGLWSSLCSNIGAEVVADSGFDWILLDGEHSPNEVPITMSQLQALVGGTASPIVRPAWNDAVMIKRILDIGAQSILVPYVQNADEAQRAVASVRYPPAGIRGVAAEHARQPLRPREQLSEACRLRDLPAGAGRDPLGAG